MRGLSLLQPWASLVAVGAKRIETRSWGTKYRGPVLIHASKGSNGRREWLSSREMTKALAEAGYGMTDDLPRGAVIAVAELTNCLEITSLRLPDEREQAFGNYTPGRFAWLLKDVRRLPRPVACNGSLGLWRVDGALAIEVELQLEAHF